PSGAAVRAPIPARPGVTGKRSGGRGRVGRPRIDARGLRRSRREHNQSGGSEKELFHHGSPGPKLHQLPRAAAPMFSPAATRISHAGARINAASVAGSETSPDVGNKLPQTQAKARHRGTWLGCSEHFF